MALNSSGSDPAALVTYDPTTTGSVVTLNTAIDHFAELVLDGFTIHKLGGDANVCVQGTSGTLRRCIVLGNGLGLGVGTNYDLAVDTRRDKSPRTETRHTTPTTKGT